MNDNESDLLLKAFTSVSPSVTVAIMAWRFVAAILIKSGIRPAELIVWDPFSLIGNNAVGITQNHFRVICNEADRDAFPFLIDQLASDVSVSRNVVDVDMGQMLEPYMRHIDILYYDPPWWREKDYQDQIRKISNWRHMFRVRCQRDVRRLVRKCVALRWIVTRLPADVPPVTVGGSVAKLADRSGFIYHLWSAPRVVEAEPVVEEDDGKDHEQCNPKLW